MAGSPKKRALAAAIEGVGGEAALLDLVATGAPVSSIARQLDVSRGMLSQWLNSDPDRKAKYAQAREAAADSLVDQGLEIVDAASVQETQLAKLRSDYRRWMASRLNAGTWGEQRGPLVAISAENLHIQALTKAGPVFDQAPIIEHDSDQAPDPDWLE